MKHWPIAGMLLIALVAGCSEEDTRQEPARAPDAGHRFVEQPEGEDAEPAPGRTEKLQASPEQEPVDAAATPAERAPEDRTAAAEGEAEAPPPPPAGPE